MGLSLLFLSGCRKEEQPVVQPAKPSLPSVAERMADPEYVKKLDAQGDQQKELLRKRSTVVAELQKMSKARMAEMKGASAEDVKASLEKDPAWQELEKRLKDINTVIEENRQRTLAIVRGRMATQQNKVSK